MVLTAADFVHPGERPLHGRTTEAEAASATSSGFRARKERDVVRAAGAVVGVARDVKVGCRGFRGVRPLSLHWSLLLFAPGLDDSAVVSLLLTHNYYSSHMASSQGYYYYYYYYYYY